MNYLKSLLIVLLTAMGTNQVFAHALWIETDVNGKLNAKHEVKIFYGEYVANERDSVQKWYSDVRDFTLWLTTPKNEKIKLETKAGANYYGANFTPTQEGVYLLTVVHEAKELGGTTKYEFSSVAPVAVGKNAIISGSAIANPLHAIATEAKVYKVNSAVKVNAYLNGTAAQGKTVTVFSPEGWSKDFTVSADGTIEFLPLWPGRYVLEASNYEEKSGQHNGKAYTAAWQGATSSFVVSK